MTNSGLISQKPHCAVTPATPMLMSKIAITEQTIWCLRRRLFSSATLSQRSMPPPYWWSANIETGWWVERCGKIRMKHWHERGCGKQDPTLPEREALDTITDYQRDPTLADSHRLCHFSAPEQPVWLSELAIPQPLPS